MPGPTPRLPLTSTGTLRFEPGKLYVEVCPGIVDLTRALIPPVVSLNKQRYAPHISVIRKEALEGPWGVPYDGETLEFSYDPRVVPGGTYWWLRAWSDRLVEVRQELGLIPLDWYCRPPDNEDCFHITVGNLKHRSA